jgi:pilus assembly protein CpaE
MSRASAEGLVAQDKSLIIIDSDDATRGLFGTIARGIPGARVAADSADLALGLKLARQTRPALLVCEVDPTGDDLAVLERFHQEHPGTSILATCRDESADTVLKCLRAGAKEFVKRPVSIDDAKKAVERLLRFGGGPGGTQSKIIAVFSNKGGTGTSTIAVNLAVALAQVTGQGVALADLDHQAGEVALFLNLRPTRTLADLGSGSGRLDAAVVQSTLVKHPSNVYILCSPDRPEQMEGVTAARVHEVLQHLQSSFPFVVVDLTHSFSDISLEVFDAAQHILVVTLLNLPAIGSARRCLDVFRKLNYLRDEEKVRVVINRYLPNRDIDVSQLEETLHYPVFWKVPNDYATVIDAVNSGLPVFDVNPDSEVSRSFRSLAADLAGVEVAAMDNSKSSAGLFGKLLGRKR